MEQLISALLCSAIVDEVIIRGHDIEEHEANLKKVLEHAQEVNLRLSPQKI